MDIVDSCVTIILVKIILSSIHIGKKRMIIKIVGVKIVSVCGVMIKVVI